LKFLYKAIRPQYISLVEAFDIPDVVLNSAVGNQYGDIYEEFFNAARNSRLNRGQQGPFMKGLKETFGDIITTPLAKL